VSRSSGPAPRRWREHWKAAKRLRWGPRWSLDARLALLTFINALLYWPWHWLRVAFDAGDHHPNLVFGLLLVTLWMWLELLKAVTGRFWR
jgi:hypothetical protein